MASSYRAPLAAVSRARYAYDLMLFSEGESFGGVLHVFSAAVVAVGSLVSAAEVARQTGHNHRHHYYSTAIIPGKKCSRGLNLFSSLWGAWSWVHSRYTPLFTAVFVTAAVCMRSRVFGPHHLYYCCTSLKSESSTNHDVAMLRDKN